jgi:uncharacterized Zn finger protein (UPF0148 family)
MPTCIWCRVPMMKHNGEWICRLCGDKEINKRYKVKIDET